MAALPFFLFKLALYHQRLCKQAFFACRIHTLDAGCPIIQSCESEAFAKHTKYASMRSLNAGCQPLSIRFPDASP